MNNADRSERIRALAKVALSILRRTDRYNLDLAAGGRARAWDFRHNELSLSLRRRFDADDRPATLIVKYDGEKVLVAQWTVNGWSRRSIKPGAWESVLRQCERMPAMAGR
jgi:hypothetical protein